MASAGAGKKCWRKKHPEIKLPATTCARLYSQRRQIAQHAGYSLRFPAEGEGLSGWRYFGAGAKLNPARASPFW